MRNLRNNDGFTLIELMIVVVIIGILAAIAIPKFTQVSKSAKEAEADGILKQAYSLQQSYYQRHDTYGSNTSLASLGWTTAQDAKYYDFTISSANADDFCVQAAKNNGDGTKADVKTKHIRKDRKVTDGACPAA